MSTRAGERSVNAYTPSHMNAGTLPAPLQRIGMARAGVRARLSRARSDIASQSDAGTTQRLAPHPRERSVE